MGVKISKLVQKMFATQEARLLMLGLDAAGKTTILYTLKQSSGSGEEIQAIPTVGFNVETVTFGKTNFHVWDVGGQDKIRPLWRHYFTGTSAVIFVVDSNDQARMDEAKKELEQIVLEREIQDAPVLVFANKQDIPNALKGEEVAEKMGMNEWERRNIMNPWAVYPSDALQGEGLEVGIQWLDRQLMAAKKKGSAALSNRERGTALETVLP